jgi:hypothetical protein
MSVEIAPDVARRIRQNAGAVVVQIQGATVGLLRPFRRHERKSRDCMTARRTSQKAGSLTTTVRRGSPRSSLVQLARWSIHDTDRPRGAMHGPRDRRNGGPAASWRRRLLGLTCVVVAVGGVGCGRDEDDAIGGPTSSDPAGLGLSLTRSAGARTFSACGVERRSASYLAGASVGFTGQVKDSDSMERVRLIVRRCLRGRFVTVMRLTLPADDGGRFTGSFPVKVPSDCYVQAIHAGVSSPRRYFVVRSRL